MKETERDRSGRDWQDVTGSDSELIGAAAALLSNHIVSLSSRSFNLIGEVWGKRDRLKNTVEGKKE